MFENLHELNQAEMGKRIRSARESIGMTREELAEVIDVSVQFIADVEYGNKGVSIKTLFLLKQALGVTADYILSGRLYAADEDEEAIQICSDLVAILRTCNEKQLGNFREISRIYADNVPHKPHKD